MRPRERHGGRVWPEYRVWHAMINRCCNPRDKRWPRYGGRGIKVCDAWRDSFARFIGDMGRRPSARHSIDRIDNDGGYAPGNCRWALPAEQSSNSTRPRRLTLNGETMSLRAWAKRAGINSATLVERLQRGWPLEEALTSGPTHRARRYAHIVEGTVEEAARKTTGPKQKEAET